jgi:hypothetical protein
VVAGAGLEGGYAQVKTDRFYVNVNREIGNPIIEIRDRSSESERELIAEFYPGGWRDAFFEARRFTAYLNGNRLPKPSDFQDERFDEIERRLSKLERAQ